MDLLLHLTVCWIHEISIGKLSHSSRVQACTTSKIPAFDQGVVKNLRTWSEATHFSGMSSKDVMIHDVFFFTICSYRAIYYNMFMYFGWLFTEYFINHIPKMAIVQVTSRKEAKASQSPMRSSGRSLEIWRFESTEFVWNKQLWSTQFLFSW